MSPTEKPKKDGVKRPAHRPTLCTRELADEFARCLQTSPWIEPAAALCGITRHTANNWLGRGEAERQRRLDGEDANDDEEPFVYFFTTIARARAQWEATLAGSITRMSQPSDPMVSPNTGKPYEHQGDANLALATLKCAFPDRWGQRNMQVTSKVEVSAAPPDLDALTDEELLAYEQVMAKMAGTDDEDGDA